jgi:CIC family chloride channel protein
MLRAWQAFLGLLRPNVGPVDLRILGRTLLHAVLVGATAGALGVAFSHGVQRLEDLLLLHLAGYIPLRPAGEHVDEAVGAVFHPFLLLVIPALGATAAGWVAYKWAPEVLGGGGDAAIRTFHKQDAIVRRRVPLVKMLASVLTLGTGGSGGREGPTMQIGSGVASLVARWLRVPRQERRVLYVAGIAAGIAAVFRTPLGAALFAVEVLYRDDFESDALIPAVLASVVAFSIALPFAETSQLFAHAPTYPFVPAHLPYFLGLALVEVVVALGFLRSLHGVRAWTAKLPGPIWIRPGIGGLLLGALAAPILVLAGKHLGKEGEGYGILGGGYGAAQVAITGADWLPGGWTGVGVLAALCAVKLVASSFTIGTGGSAGDFAPSLVLGGLVGGAYGRAVALISGDPRIDAGAFALVGMGTLFGGAAHVPLSSLVLVCEMAGSYDLVVPLMLAEGVAYVALHRESLYEAQAISRNRPAEPTDDAPIAGREPIGELGVKLEGWVAFESRTGAQQMLDRASEVPGQTVFPVVDEGKLVGLVTIADFLPLAVDPALGAWVVAADVMQAARSFLPSTAAAEALREMVSLGFRQMPVVAPDGRLLGLLDETVLVAHLVRTERVSLAMIAEPPEKA